jgi:hypothetical protein
MAFEHRHPYRFPFVDVASDVIGSRFSGCFIDIEAIGQAVRWLPAVRNGEAAKICDGRRLITTGRREAGL